MSAVHKRPLPRQQSQAPPTPHRSLPQDAPRVPMTKATAQHDPYRMPVATPVAAQYALQPASTPAATPNVSQPVRPGNRFRMLREQERRVRSGIILSAATIPVFVVVVALLVVLFTQPPGSGGTHSQTETAGSGLPTASTPAPRDKGTVCKAVDVYEFLKVMQGTAFLAEEDIEHLLGKPYSVVQSPEGIIRTHMYSGGAVQYQLSPDNPRVIRAVAQRKANERSREEIKRGEFQTACQLLRVPDHREYCRMILEQEGKKLAAAKPADPPSPARSPTLSYSPMHIAHKMSERREAQKPAKPGANVLALQNDSSEDASIEPASPNRIWTSKDGAYACQAEFVKFENSKVHLKKEDGNTVQLSLYKLVDTDRVWIQRYLKERKQELNSVGRHLDRAEAEEMREVAQTAAMPDDGTRVGLFQLVE